MKKKASIFILFIMLISTSYNPSYAQTTEDQVSPTGKGIVGCALLGGEVALIIQGALKVKNPYLLSIIPIVTAGGGGIGGYYLEEVSTEGAIATLISGMALIIPTAIIVMVGISKAKEEVEGYVDTTREGEFVESEVERETPPREETETEVIGPPTTPMQGEEQNVSPPQTEPLPPSSEQNLEGETFNLKLMKPIPELKLSTAFVNQF